jgi:hypothetical protein
VPGLSHSTPPRNCRAEAILLAQAWWTVWWCVGVLQGDSTMRLLRELTLRLDEQVLGFAAVVGTMTSVLMAVWLTS